MTQLFLKAKHWQIFLLTYGIPLIAQIILMGKVFSGMFNASTEPDPFTMFDHMMWFPFIMMVFMIFYMGWFWSVGTGLQEKISDDLKMKTRWFKLFIIIPAVYMCFFVFFFFGMMHTLSNGLMGDYIGGDISVMGIIFPLHLFSMFCMFYTMYFVSKTIKTAEVERKVKFSDFAGEFFMLWFFPVGIWILQPRINKLNDASLIEDQLV